MYLAYFLPLAVLPFAFAVNHNVTVGADKSNKEGLYYTPDTLNPKVDDKIVFTFVGDSHSVAQSSFDKPCEYLENGIFSGFPGLQRRFLIRSRAAYPHWSTYLMEKLIGDQIHRARHLPSPSTTRILFGCIAPKGNIVKEARSWL